MTRVVCCRYGSLLLILTRVVCCRYGSLLLIFLYVLFLLPECDLHSTAPHCYLANIFKVASVQFNSPCGPQRHTQCTPHAVPPSLGAHC